MNEYVRIRRIGRGGSAEVWLARDPAGREVALKRAAPADAALARAVAALGHPGVLGVLDEVDGTLVLPYVPGGSLAAALAAGARYAAPQAAALGAALADALAAVHAAGLAHGDVKPGNVVLSGAGTPLLADFRAGGTPAGDVAALAVLCARLDPALAPVVAGAASAAELRDRLAAFDGAVDGDDPEPTRDFGPRPPARPAPAAPAPGRRALPGRGALPGPVRLVAAVVGLLVAAAVVGWSLPRASSAGALPEVPPPDWHSTLVALDAARSAAFARSDPRGLAAVYVPGSAPHRADRALLARYAKRRARVADLHLVTESVRVVSTAPGVATLEVTDRLLPYTLVDAAGRPVARYAGRGVRRWLVTLRQGAGGWRIAEVARATAPAS